jgi:hypothetical protein
MARASAETSAHLLPLRPLPTPSLTLLPRGRGRSPGLVGCRVACPTLNHPAVCRRALRLGGRGASPDNHGPLASHRRAAVPIRWRGRPPKAALRVQGRGRDPSSGTPVPVRPLPGTPPARGRGSSSGHLGPVGCRGHSRQPEPSRRPRQQRSPPRAAAGALLRHPPSHRPAGDFAAVPDRQRRRPAATALPSPCRGRVREEGARSSTDPQVHAELCSRLRRHPRSFPRAPNRVSQPP